MQEAVRTVSRVRVYFVRLNISQIQMLTAAPARLWLLSSMLGFETTELMDTAPAAIDLLLRTLRKEKLCEARVLPGNNPLDVDLLGDDELTIRALEIFAATIDGRCAEPVRQDAIGFGFGNACTLPPTIVRDLCKALEYVTAGALSQALQVEMSAQPRDASQAGEQPSVEGALSAFTKLRYFLDGAKAYGQYVLTVRA